MVLRQNLHNKRVGGNLLFLKAKAPEVTGALLLFSDLYIHYSGVKLTKFQTRSCFVC